MKRPLRTGRLLSCLPGCKIVRLTCSPYADVWLTPCAQTLSNALVNNNQGQGIWAVRSALRRSSEVFGNAASQAACDIDALDSLACVDVLGQRKPRVDSSSTCGQSADESTGASFGVCTND